MDNKEPTKKPARRRARRNDGQYKSDNPTATANEAWEPVEIPLKKDNPYKVKQKVKGLSNSEESAGKYASKPKTRPSFGNVKTTFH